MSTQDRLGRGAEAARGDVEEREGDAADGEALRMRALQRRWIQRKAARGGAGAAGVGGAGAAGAGGGGAAAIPESGGAPLGGTLRGRMEGALGADLSGVRVHTGGESAEAADALGARAFTVGSDVHFGRGEFAPGSKEGDRLLAHELAHVVQGQKSGVQRKAAHDSDGEDGDHEAGGHEVSEPGDPAEHEADAAADHATESLHGDGDGESAHGAAHGGGKKVAREPKPKLGAAAPGVGRKIFRAPRPGAPATAGANAKAGSKPAPAATPPGNAMATAANALSPQDQQKIQRIKTAIAQSAKPDFMLVSTLRLYQDDVDKLTAGAQAKDPAVVELKTAFDAKWNAAFEAFDQALATSVNSLKALKVDDPNAYASWQAVVKGADPWAFAGLLKQFKDRPAWTAYLDAKQTAEKSIRDAADQAFVKATSDVKAISAEADPAKPGDDPTPKTEAVFEAARPWFNKVPGTLMLQETLQNAFVTKREQIAAAQTKRQEEQKKQQHAGGAPGDTTRNQPGAAPGPQPASATATPGATTAPAAPQTAVAGATKPAAPPATVAVAATTTPAAKPPSAAPPPPPQPKPAVTPVPEAMAGANPQSTDAAAAPAVAADHAPAAAAAPPSTAASHAPEPTPQAGAPAHADGEQHGEQPNSDEAAQLTKEQQELIAIISGLAAEYGTRATKTDAVVATGLSVISTLGAWLLHADPVIGGLLGVTSMGISAFVGGEKRERLERAKQIAELVPLLKDPEKIAEVIQLYSMGVTDLETLQMFIEAKIQEQPPPPLKMPEGDAEGERPKGARAEEEPNDDEKEKEHDHEHGGALHAAHKGEKVAHVLHTGAEFGTKVFEFLHHAHGALPAVGLAITSVKDFLAAAEVSELKEAIEKKKKVDERLAAVSGATTPQQTSAAGSTPPPPTSHH